MRPLRLKLAGLRSYREEQEVDFTDAGLIAIVGDTGAGKSSLLEALTVALYGTSTWDGKEIKPLISDGGNTMQVSLLFRADGKEWRVERAISRGNYPPARHTLELVSGGERYDKKEAVDAKIRQLVGLDYDAFLRSVVLPQGRFAALLQATPKERASILKGILRIDRLDTVRDEARDARDRMVPVVEGLRERRSRLLPDPAAAEKDAELRMASAAKERDGVLAAKRELASQRERGRAAAERRRALEALLGRAREGRVSGAAEALRSLSDRDAELAAALDRNEAELVQKRGEEAELAAMIEEAERKGEGPVSLGHAKSGLSMLASELPLLTEEGASIEKDAALLEKDAAELERAEAALAALAASEGAAKTRYGELKAEAKRLDGAVAEARRIGRELQAARSEEAKTLKKNEKAKGDLDRATEQLHEAQGDAKKAEEKLAEAEGLAKSAAQKHAAHHASEGLKGGEPCPVCERPLPDGFKAPRAPALESAQKKLEKARADGDKAREKLSAAKTKVDAAKERAAEAAGDLAERAAEVQQAARRLEEVLPGAAEQGEEKAILAAAAKSEAAAAALTEAEAEAQRARDAATQKKAEVGAAKARWKERKEDLKKKKEALSIRKKRLDETVAKMPADVRPRQPYASADIGALTARVELRRLKIEKVVQELHEVRGARGALEEARRDIETRRQREVTARAGELDVGLATSRERLSLLAEALPAEALPPRPEGAHLAELSGWAEEMERRAEALLGAAEAEVVAARGIAAAAEDAVRGALIGAGVESEGALDAALSRAEGQYAAAAFDLTRARADKPLAAALDERIERAHGLLSALGEVARLVSDGKLVSHVVQRRQRVLLAVASELLGSMTRSRYGFSEDFEVVDRVSGQARGTRTLSGGETFLASLALSLSLVELAGRAGGRLEALFLDEGFGSLDASCLGEALDALTQKAEGGRLVAVISHLRSVAESIDKVLAVRLSPGGSRVGWVSAAERERMLSEDVERGLIS